MQPISLHELKALAFMNCLWHELCLTARWLQFNSWSRRNTGEKSWQSQFMMSCLQSEQHQFIHKKRARTNGILSIISLLLFYEFFNLPLGNITRDQRARISLRHKPFQIIRGIPFVRPRANIIVCISKHIIVARQHHLRL